MLVDIQLKINLMPVQIKKALISGGGTGGHIFPAIAIANALKRRYPEIIIQFVGASDRMEMQKVPEAGYPIKGLWIAGYQRGQIIKNILLPFKILWSLLCSFWICWRFNPDVAVGVGGYASAPMLYAASFLNVPCLIQEQNSYAGITNKILGNKVQKVCVAYEDMSRFFPTTEIIMTGNPVRKDLKDVAALKKEGLKFFGLKENKTTVLVIGGSLGAKSINEAIEKHLSSIEKLNVQLLWQTGVAYAEKSNVLCSSLNNSGIKCMPFIKEMKYAYAIADIVISRAGALSISELCVLSKAAILVPSPNVTEDHQRKNAMALVDKKAALMLEDKEVKEYLLSVLSELIKDEEKQLLLRSNINKLSFENADERIVDEIEKMLV